MYDDLVLHHGSSTGKQHQHGVRLTNTMVTDDHIDWCLENLEMDSWTWEDQHIMGVDFAMFTFVREEDSVLFRLVWG